MTNWYKCAAGIEQQLASKIAELLVNSFKGYGQSSLEKIHNIVAAFPDEPSLLASIQKAVSATLKATGQTQLTAEQGQIVQLIQNVFQQNQLQPSDMIEPAPDEATKDMAAPGGLSEQDVLQQDEQLGFIRP